MVDYDKMDIHKVMTFDWSPGRDIKENLRKQLGLDNLKWYQKAAYVLSLQSWNINTDDFYFKLGMLEEEGFVSHRIIPKEILGHSEVEYQFKKIVGGKRVEIQQPVIVPSIDDLVWN